MPTVAVPSSTRDQAEAVITAQIGHGFSHQTRLEDLGPAAVVQLLLDLEDAFDILIEVDQVLPDGTIGGLLGLVVLAMRTADPARAAADSFILYDFATECRLRSAERARRALTRTRIESVDAANDRPHPSPIVGHGEGGGDDEIPAGKMIGGLLIMGAAAGALAAMVVAAAELLHRVIPA